MHIAINCRAFSKKEFTGIGRYASSLVGSLSQIDPDNRYSLYTTRGWGQVRRRVCREGSRNFRVCFDWLKRGVPKTLRSVDVYHAPGPEVTPDVAARIVVTVHDLIYKTYPQGHTDETLALTEAQFRSFVGRAAKLICSSRSTLDDLQKYFPEARGKACTIYQGVDKGVFYPLSGEERRAAQGTLVRAGLEGPFLLFVGTIEPRKNLNGLLEAYAQLKGKKLFAGKLAVVGMAGWKTEGLAESIERLGIKGDVVFLGFVTTDRLRELYNLAEVFVFPSFYEGFGYPIVEAFSCGAAVVTSNVSSCPELAGDAALIVNPGDSGEIAGAVATLLNDLEIRNAFREKALARAREFDNLKTARETLSVYKEVYNSK
ncbi:MAG: glycosyltransferase family 4 protein [Candidatus Omnitrophica bacterium]|nr:glycosyltransferase family 4 protein [Candidatus Omnitrophota bacterium]